MNTTASQSRGSVRRVRVDADGAGQRIDNFLLRELKGLPRSRVYKLLRKGEVRVNGGRIGPTYKLKQTDEVRIPPVRLEEPTQAAPQVPAGLRQRLLNGVLHEDDRLLVLDKPPGIPVHGGSGQAWGLIEAMRVLRPELSFLELAHRLDRDTSGCLVLAKKRSALREVHEALREGRAEKRYLTLLKGRLPRGAVPVEAALDKRERRGGERTVRVSAAGKPARTVFRTTQRYGFGCLVEAEITTGRTHQIRVHAAHLGHPVLGDDRYGDREANRALRPFGLKRIFLHAHSLRLRLGDKQELMVSAPLSADLRAVLQAAEEEGA